MPHWNCECGSYLQTIWQEWKTVVTSGGIVAILFIVNLVWTVPFYANLVVMTIALLIAPYGAWKSEHGARKKAESALGWDNLAKEFERFTGIVSAEWTVSVENVEPTSFAVRSAENTDGALCEQYCRRGGKRLLQSRLVSFYPSLEEEKDDLGRWILALDLVLGTGTLPGLATFRKGAGPILHYETREIAALPVKSRLLCLKVGNEYL